MLFTSELIFRADFLHLYF